jgi:hypothetical protein
LKKEEAEKEVDEDDLKDDLNERIETYDKPDKPPPLKAVTSSPEPVPTVSTDEKDDDDEPQKPTIEKPKMKHPAED